MSPGLQEMTLSQRMFPQKQGSSSATQDSPEGSNTWTMMEPLEENDGISWAVIENSRGQSFSFIRASSGQDASRIGVDAETAMLNPHPHISSCEGIATINNDHGTVWHNIPIPDAEKLVKVKGRLPVGQVVTIVVPIVQALQHLHAAGYTMGRIYPKLIGFDLRGAPQIQDAWVQPKRFSTEPDSRLFFAPEVQYLAADAYVPDAASDVYGVAALAWFLLSGTAPAPATQRTPLPLVVPGIDSKIVDILEACLAATPADRPTMTTFLDNVYYWAEPEPVELHLIASSDMVLSIPTRQISHSSKKKVNRKFSGKTSLRPVVRSKVTRRLGIGGLAMLLAAGLATLGMNSPETDIEKASAENAAPSQSNEQIATEDVQKIVDGLAKARSQALDAQDLEAVSKYAYSSGDIFQQDQDQIRQLKTQELHFEGLRMRAVVQESTQDPAAGSMTVDVSWRISPYTTVDGSGQIVDEHQSATETVFSLELREDQGKWKMYQLQQASQS